MADNKLEQELKLRDDKINKLKALVIKEKKLNAESNDKLSKIEKELSLTREENKTLSSQIERLCQNIGELQSNQSFESDYQVKLSTLEEQLTEKEKIVQEYEEKLKKLQERSEELISIENSKFTELTNKLNDQREIFESELANDKKIIDELKFSNNELHESLKLIENQLAENSEQFSSKLKESASVIEDLENKLMKNSDYISTIKSLEEERSRLIESQNDLNDQLSTLQMMYQSSQCLADNLKNELETKNETISKIETMQDRKCDDKFTQSDDPEVFSCQVSENLQLSSELLSDFEYLFVFLKSVTETGSVDRSQLPENLQSYPSLYTFLDYLEKLIYQNTNMTDANDTLQDGIQSLNRKCEQLEEIIEKSEREKTAIESKLQCLEVANKKESDALDEHLSNICKSISLFFEVIKNNSDMDLYLKDVADNIKCHKDFSDILEKLRHMHNTNQELLSKHSLSEDENNQLINSLNSQLENEKVAHLETQKQLDVLTGKLNSFNVETSAAIDTQNNLVQQLKQLEEQLSTKTHQVESMESIVEDNRNIARALENEKDTLQLELVEMRTRNEEKEAFLEEESKEIKAKLDQMNVKYNEDIENRDNEIQSLKKERQILQQEIDLLQAEIDRKDFDIKEAGSERDSLMETISSMKNERETLEKEFNDTISELRSELAAKESVLQSLRYEIKQAQNMQADTLQQCETTLKQDAEILALKEEAKHLSDTVKLRDSVIANLESLKEQQANQLKDNSDVVNMLQDELKVKQNLINELEGNVDALKCQMESNENHYKNTLDENDKLLSKRMEDLELLNSEKDSLLSKLSTLESTNLMNSNQANNKEQSQTVKDLENKCSKLESQIVLHEATIANLRAELDTQHSQIENLSYEKSKLENNFASDKASMESDMARLKELLDGKEKSLLIMQEDLSNALKSARQNSVMDLELAEFEKTVSSYKDQLDIQEKELSAFKEEISKKESQISAYRQQLKDSESLKKQADDRANKLKQILVKTKKELSELRKSSEECKSVENKRNVEIESLTSQLELSKLQYSEISTQMQKLEDKLSQSKTIYESKLKSTNTLVATLKDDLKSIKEERDALKTEFDAYKQKVHKAFKESKPKTSVNQISISEAQEHSERLESVVEKLKLKLEDVEDELAGVRCEAELCQRECDRWVDKYHKLEEAYQLQEQQWQERYDRLSIENSHHENESLATIQQLSTENESISNAFREQIKSIKDEHKETVVSLRSELEASENEILKLQEENWALREQRNQMKFNQSSNNQTQVSSANVLGTANNQPSYSMVTTLQERQQGEGMENPEIEQLSIVTSGSHLTPRLPDQSSNRDNFFSKSGNSRHLIPLDQLLDSSSRDDNDQDDVDSLVSSTHGGTSISLKKHEQMINALKSDVTSKSKQINHLTDLLNDSEAMVVRLTEQAKVLKDEIRRYEKNDERSAVLKNSETTEYLKNVILKFLSLNPGDERMQLIPVLTTLLSLTVEEKNSLIKVAEIHHDQSAEAQGWANYFSWAGLS